MPLFPQTTSVNRRTSARRSIAAVIAAILSLLFPSILALVSFCLSLWIVIPAFTGFLLPLGVGAPEVSPWLLAMNAIALVLSFIGLQKSWFDRVAFALSVAGLVISALPLLQLPAASASFAKEMQAGLGANYLQKIPAEASSRMRTQPFSLLDAFRGIPQTDIRIDRGIPFATPIGIPLKLNVYRPLQTGTYPAIVIIYGGAWRSGTPNNDELFSHYIAAQGYTVLTVDYRHAPRFRFPTQLEDVRSALTYIQQHAADLEVDLNRVAVMGRSAGAHLAMLTAYQTPPFPIRAVVNYYGPVDLTRGYNDPPKPDPINTREILRSFLGGTPTQLPDLYRQASPITYVTRPLQPTLLVYAGRDHLVQAKFGRQLYQQLRENGTRTVLLEIPWAEHAFDAVFNGVSNQVALYYTERFLAWALKR